jgi:hypothetical protein
VDSVDIFTKLPLEFAAEADKLTLKLEGSWLMNLNSPLEIKDLHVSINDNEILKI